MDDPTKYLRKEISLDCNDHCSKLQISQFQDKDDGEVYIAHYTNSFYSYQDGYWEILKRRFRIIWNTILGKEYCFYEIVLMNNSEIKQFKEFVAQLDETLAFYD